jgi:predicted secreted protein
VNWFLCTVTFILLWWLVWFCALPIGVSPSDAPEVGHEPGAPVKPYLWWKALGTTLVAAALTGIVYWLVASDYISFRDWTS